MGTFNQNNVDISYSESLGATAKTGFFEILNPWVPADATASTNQYDVYTTKGTLALVAEEANAYFGFGSKEIYMYNYNDKGAHNNVYNSSGKYYEGSVSCETYNNEKYRSSVSHPSWDAQNWEKDHITYCVDKGDIILPLSIGADTSDSNKRYVNYNPADINLYRAQKLWTKTAPEWDAQVWGEGGSIDVRTKMFKHTIKTDLSMNWGTKTDADHFRLYKFFPHSDSTYHYVAECSNRGLCDADGICECFPGYGNDNCNEQNSLAV